MRSMNQKSSHFAPKNNSWVLDIATESECAAGLEMLLHELLVGVGVMKLREALFKNHVLVSFQ